MPAAALFDAFPPRNARVHEVCGPGAHVFAAITAARLQTDLLLVRDRWRSEVLYPQGLLPFFDPGRLLVARVSDQTEALAVAEEALRDGSLGLVVIELGEPLGLTPGRRLQLAAKAGGTLGLCLIGEGQGSPAAETRWRCAPVFDAQDSTLQHWELTKNKSGTLGAWHVRWDPAAHRVDVVSPVGERPGSARPSR